MELLYPLSSELMTFVHLLNHTIETDLRRECDLNLVQYRTLSCLKQAGEIEEARVARALAVSASRLSQALGELAKLDYVRSRTYRGPTKLIRLSDRGMRALADADLVLIEACNAVFGPLGHELGSAIKAGSMLTNQRHGIVRIENGAFFEEHACFEAFLEAERITRRATSDFGLTYTQFRIMFELLVKGPLTKSHLAKELKLTPSVVSDTCRKLSEQDLVTDTHARKDRRVHTIALTEIGRDLVEKTAVHVDRRNFEDLRPSSDGERTLYQQMADIIVRER